MTEKEDTNFVDRWGTFNHFFDKVIQKMGLLPTESMVWLAIFRYGNENGESVVSREAIRQMTGIKSINTVDHALRHLRELQLISIKQRGYAASTGYQNCNVWAYKFLRKHGKSPQ